MVPKPNNYSALLLLYLYISFLACLAAVMSDDVNLLYATNQEPTGAMALLGRLCYGVIITII